MKNNKTLISVILPNFNSYKFLRRSINSVLKQTYNNLELIIVDDCSTDKSLEIIKSFLKIDTRVSLYSTKKNSGLVSVPRNLGLEKARGEYVAFLDSDDYWDSNKLLYQMSKIKKFDFSFVAANYQKENSKKKSNFFVNYLRIFLQEFFIKMINKYGFYWLYVYNPFLISSVIIKKKIFYKNKFDINPNIREDLNFWLKVFKNKKNKFIYHPKILLTISRSINSMSSNKVEEFNKILISISNNFLENKNFEKFKYFLIGILLRTLKIIISRFFIFFNTYLKIITLIVAVSYFIIFYSPLFWIIGNNLIYHNNQKPTDAIFVLSGHQGFEYWNNSYQQRYFDIKDYQKKYHSFSVPKFFLLGKLQSIPEQKIIESLLVSDGILKENITVIYKDYKNSESAIKLLLSEIKRDKIKSITIITSPYHSLRLSKIWNKIGPSEYDVVFFKNTNLPKKNNYFERSMNKKEIIYEILANIKFKLFN